MSLYSSGVRISKNRYLNLDCGELLFPSMEFFSDAWTAICYIGFHKGVVDQTSFDKVQSLIFSNQSFPSRMRVNHPVRNELIQIYRVLDCRRAALRRFPDHFLLDCTGQQMVRLLLTADNFWSTHRNLDPVLTCMARVNRWSRDCSPASPHLAPAPSC